MVDAWVLIIWAFHSFIVVPGIGSEQECHKLLDQLVTQGQVYEGQAPDLGKSHCIQYKIKIKDEK